MEFLEKSRVKIEQSYNRLLQEFPRIFEGREEEWRGPDARVALALRYLYTTMPLSDMANYSIECFRDFAAHGVYLWENSEAVRALPEEIFLAYVLHHRVNEEEIRPCRSYFYAQIADRADGKTAVEAAVEVNYWCAEEVTYQSADERTLSAAAVYQRGYGRCGEESVFCVNALRSVGIPARQVYAPRWSHCDDNHAWVEIWCDGKWYFTGACEPLMILNKGWFCDAASRAMIVHSRYFGWDAPAGEDVVGREGMVWILNQTARYAVVKELQLKVKDSRGEPIEKARVSFRVFNAARYDSIAETVTDAHGWTHLTAGRGSLLVHVEKDGVFREEIWNTREETQKEIVLKTENEQEECRDEWQAVDLIAPTDAPVNCAMPTEEQRLLGNRRLEGANRKRKETKDGFENPERTLFLEKHPMEKALRMEFLLELTAKDQTDLYSSVLEEHFTEASRFRKEENRERFLRYVQNPRVEHEILRPYRRAVLNSISPEEQAAFCEDPKRIRQWIERQIREYPERERTSVMTCPMGCLQSRTGSEKSKKILFCAIARTLGIPARMNEQDGMVEYWMKDRFVPADDDGEKSSRLTIRFGGKEKWIYFRNFSVARLEGADYRYLDLSGEDMGGEQAAFMLRPGKYRILTANRLPNGNLFVYQKDFCLKEKEERTEELRMRSARLDEMLESIVLPEFFLTDSSGASVLASHVTAGKKHVMIWIEEGCEPTAHILNELLSLQRDFSQYQDQLLFIVRSADAQKDPVFSKVCSAFPDSVVYLDFASENTVTLSRRMYVDPEKLPLILVTDGCGKGIYAASGYQVGLGAFLIRLLT